MKTAGLLVALLASFACQSSEVAPPAGDVVLPEHWSTDAGEGEVVLDAWWESFRDPALAEAVREALDSNPDLRKSSARVLAAEAQARIAGASRMPRVDLAGNARRQKQIFVGLPVPGADVLESTSSSFGVSLDVSWEADLWGKLSASARAAERDWHASVAEAAGARLSLAGQTAKAWFAWGEAGALLGIAESTVASWEETAAAVDRRLAAGMANALDKRLVDASLAAARANRASRSEELARGERQLELLLGRVPRGELGAAPVLPEPGPPPAAGIPAGIVSRRPDLAASEARLVAADQRLAVARSSLYPSLRLSGSIGRISSEPEDLLDPDYSVWSIVAGIVQPLFHGGELRAGVELADARVREATAAFETDLLRALGEVEIALAAEELLAEAERLALAARAEALAAEALARERYRSGTSGLLDVLEAERRSLDAQARALSLQRRRLAQRVDLYLALGGGFGSPDRAP